MLVNRTSTAYRDLLDVIGKAESPRSGYDAVVLSAKIRPNKKPTQMTLGEIKDWVNETPKQNHAIGRYQIIPKTFNRLIAKLGLSDDRVYAPALQDKLAIELIHEAGFAAYQNGKIKPETYLDNLAKIWAGLPLENGKSYYDGYAGNKATVSRQLIARTLTPKTSSNATPTQHKEPQSEWTLVDQEW